MLCLLFQKIFKDASAYHLSQSCSFYLLRNEHFDLGPLNLSYNRFISSNICTNFCLKTGPIVFFYTAQFKYKLIKALMVCLGLKPGAAGWKVQTNPLSHGGIPCTNVFTNALRGYFPDWSHRQFNIDLRQWKLSELHVLSDSTILGLAASIEVK